ncbi:MAG: RDD family protein [Bdellovibrionota bacterium]
MSPSTLQNPTSLPPAGGPPQLRIVSNQAFIPGGFWRRFAAALVDAVVLAVAQTPLRIALQLMIVGSGKPDPTFLALNALAGIVLGGAYYVYFYTNHGATPGKMVLGLKVISLSSGKNLTPGQTLLREILGKALSFFTLLLGYFLAALRPDRRALHDLIAATQVVRK